MISGFPSLFGLWIVLSKNMVLDVAFLEAVVEDSIDFVSGRFVWIVERFGRGMGGDSSSGKITSWILVRANKVCVEHRVDVEGVREFEGEV